MSHSRKAFLIYPPNYMPGDGYKVRYSKRQAWKVAVRMGEGASVDVCTQHHPAPRKSWVSFGSKLLWVVEKKLPNT
jgi:hypothetical protein